MSGRRQAKVRGPLSQDERVIVAELAGRGWSCGRIAVKLERNSGTIYYHLLEAGLVVPKLLPRPKVYYRNGVAVRGFSPAEDAHITALSLLGMSHAKIGKRCETFGGLRKPNSIRARLNQLAALAEARESASDHARRMT